MKARCSSAIAGDQLAHLHRISFPKPLTAFPASPFLPFEQLGYSWRHFWVIAESRTPVQPISVVGTARSRHLHITLIVCFAVSAQSRAVRGLKPPAPAHAPIFAHDPALTFVRMASLRPGIEHRKEHCPELAKYDVADYMFVVIRPSRDLRIESLYQFGLFLRSVSLDRFSQFLGVSLDRLWARFDSSDASDRLPVTVSVRVIFPGRILPDLESEEFKTGFSFRCFQRMNNPCFVFVEFQTYLAEPLPGDFTTLLDHFPLFVQDHEIICVAHHFRRTDVPPSWELFADNRFQTVQGNIG